MSTLLSRIRHKFTAFGELLAFDNRWELIAGQILFGKRMAIYRFRGAEILVDHRTGDHCGGARSVFATDEYRQFLPRLKFAGPLNILDLGAHVGSFPILLKVLGFQIGRLVCVEPNAATLPKLQFNLRRNLGEGHVVLNEAVGGTAGTMKLWQSGPSVGSSLIENHSPGSKCVGEVTVATFDDLYDRHFAPSVVDICKLDIEGAEFDLVAAASSSKLDRCRCIVIEVHPTAEHSLEGIVRAIVARGFRELPGDAACYSHTFCFVNPALQ